MKWGGKGVFYTYSHFAMQRCQCLRGHPEVKLRPLHPSQATVPVKRLLLPLLLVGTWVVEWRRRNLGKWKISLDDTRTEEGRVAWQLTWTCRAHHASGSWLGQGEGEDLNQRSLIQNCGSRGGGLSWDIGAVVAVELTALKTWLNLSLFLLRSIAPYLLLLGQVCFRTRNFWVLER